ncbi:HTTM domain-containing protein [Flagellimonas halotolerans]|uniref:HTTM domain-containing protein n=1 Tax=Flagellimonas halotolerans TaxID=3112164 RepID=A0ABU6IPN5_9FLAO|nr:MULTISPECIES: HTTM domain-containing protein [unclassified Allomuricauda]MEC3965075.1 HTTM domain-containing protein [Muricauda sp. SYSU M86414]MEC4265080.1 HTTM domain-containing protein [Muricauda sp. SYSU M84420]
MAPNLDKYLHRNVEAAPLAVFRIFFGLMMLWSIIRFWANGWIEKLYLEPKFHFSYYGFEWVKPLGTPTYLVFILCAISAIGIALGYKYRLSIGLFFLSFTYIELMDKTTYLNHYYFISILSFLMIFLPANAYFSVDAKRGHIKAFQYVPKWTIDGIKLLLGIVYCYAGLAKLNSDWLIKAMPLKIWLPSKFYIPLIGDLMTKEWVHYTLSWGGALYDLTIPFLLLWNKTRYLGFFLVVFFHVLTRVLFPIGMFPYIMILSALIFFDAKLHHRILAYISKIVGVAKSQFDNGKVSPYKEGAFGKLKYGLVALFFAIQLLFPWRYQWYPGELFWTEEGYRFSWRVMLMEKSGYAQFKIVDKVTKKWFYVDNKDFLTPFQEKQMAFQPDFILEYAHYLKQHFEKDGHQNIGVYVESYVALNGRLSQPFIDPKVDLAQEKDSFKHKTWILPFKDEIKGI